MIGTTGDNTNSLSLALDARQAVKSLLALQKAGPADQRLSTVLADAVTSLTALNSGTSLFAQLSASSSYESYEQIRILQYAQTALKDDRLIEKLRALMADPKGVDATENVKSAIQFFTAIENRALQRYNQSFGSGL